MANTGPRKQSSGHQIPVNQAEPKVMVMFPPIHKNKCSEQPCTGLTGLGSCQRSSSTYWKDQFSRMINPASAISKCSWTAEFFKKLWTEAWDIWQHQKCDREQTSLDPRKWHQLQGSADLAVGHPNRTTNQATLLQYPEETITQIHKWGHYTTVSWIGHDIFRQKNSGCKLGQ